jgi:hypothetical protein
MRRTAWRKSSYSGGSGQSNCVEVRSVPGRVAVRDSKDPGGGVLAVTAGEWRAFIGVVKGGASGRV